MKIIILGLGNPLFGDDGVGCRVAQAFGETIDQPDINVQEFGGAGLDILDLVVDYDKAIVIDAIHTDSGVTGTIYHFGIDQISASTAVGPHQMDFIEALRLGRQTGLNIPGDISIYAIEAGEIGRVMEECSPAVNAAIPICIDLIVKELKTTKIS